MGLFTSYLIYRSGKKRAARQIENELADLEDELGSICDHCGYTLAQHSQDGQYLCPRY